MKLRNLIFALFLAIGAIGFTACTGDDGDSRTGWDRKLDPAGPQGEPGEDAGDLLSTMATGFLTELGETFGIDGSCADRCA